MCVDEGVLGCLTSRAESAAFLHNVQVLTFYPAFSLPTTHFSSFKTSFISSLRLFFKFLLQFASCLPFSYLLLISHTLSLFLVFYFCILLVTSFVSYFCSPLDLIIPHLLLRLLPSFSAFFFQVYHTFAYFHFTFALLLILPTLPLLLLSSLHFLHIAAPHAMLSLLVHLPSALCIFISRFFFRLMHYFRPVGRILFLNLFFFPPIPRLFGPLFQIFLISQFVPLPTNLPFTPPFS